MAQTGSLRDSPISLWNITRQASIIYISLSTFIFQACEMQPIKIWTLIIIYSSEFKSLSQSSLKHSQVCQSDKRHDQRKP